MHRRGAPIAILSLFACPASAQTRHTKANDTTVLVATGVDYQRGSYGLRDKVEVTSVPTTLSVRHKKVTLSATVPFVRLNAPADVAVGGLLGVPVIAPPTQTTTRRTRRGLGDVRLTGAYLISAAPVGLSLSAQVKLPTASTANGIGTGKIDVAVGGELFKQMGSVTPYIDLGYTMPGSPSAYRLNNSVSAQVGTALQIGPGMRVHVGYAYAQAISPTLRDQQSLAGGINVGRADKATVALYGNAGLSRGAPNMTAGIQLGVRLK